ncbi:hypothetical protein V6N13_108815 [Hibiscus sabdariffa]
MKIIVSSVIPAGNLTLDSSGVPADRPPETIRVDVPACLERPRSPSLIQELHVIKRERTPDVGSVEEVSCSKDFFVVMDTTMGESTVGGVAQPVACAPTMTPSRGGNSPPSFRDILAGAKSVPTPLHLVSDLDVDVREEDVLLGGDRALRFSD